MSTGERQAIHVTTLGGVDWHMHSYKRDGTF